MKRVTVLAGVVAVLFAGPILLAAEPASESEEASAMSMQKMHKMHKMMIMNNMEMEDEGSQNMADDMPCQRMDAMQDRHHDMQEHKQMMQEMKEHMAEHQSTQEEPSE